MHITLSSQHKQGRRAYFFWKREYCIFLTPFLISWFLSTLKWFQYFCFPFQQIRQTFSLVLNSDNWSSLFEKKIYIFKRWLLWHIQINDCVTSRPSFFLVITFTYQYVTLGGIRKNKVKNWRHRILKQC